MVNTDEIIDLMKHEIPVRLNIPQYPGALEKLLDTILDILEENGYMVFKDKEIEPHDIDILKTVVEQFTYTVPKPPDTDVFGSVDDGILEDDVTAEPRSILQQLQYHGWKIFPPK